MSLAVGCVALSLFTARFAMSLPRAHLHRVFVKVSVSLVCRQLQLASSWWPACAALHGIRCSGSFETVYMERRVRGYLLVV